MTCSRRSKSNHTSCDSSTKHMLLSNTSCDGGLSRIWDFKARSRGGDDDSEAHEFEEGAVIQATNDHGNIACLDRNMLAVKSLQSIYFVLACRINDLFTPIKSIKPAPKKK